MEAYTKAQTNKRLYSLIAFLDNNLTTVRKIIYWMIIIIFTLMVLVVFSQVVWRFVFNNPFPWSEELARYLQVWLILLASVACIRKGKHLAVDYFTQSLKFSIAKILKLSSLFVIMVFTSVLFAASIYLIVITIPQITPAIKIPIMLVYLSFPVSSVFMLMETLLLFLKIVWTRNRSEMEATENDYYELTTPA